jgi:hypothetical protein
MRERFTNRQVTAMIVAVCAAAVLAPVGVQAATGTYMNIVDPVYPSSKARVTAKGQLYVLETDPITSTRARVSTGGKRLVGDGSGALTVDGAVRAIPTRPSKPWNNVNGMTLSPSHTYETLYQNTDGPNMFSLSSMSLAATPASTAGSVTVHLGVYVASAGSSGNCDTLSGFGAAERFNVVVPMGETLQLNWPTPLVYSAYAQAGHLYCVRVSASGPAGFTLYVSANGFLG